MEFLCHWLTFAVRLSLVIFSDRKQARGAEETEEVGLGSHHKGEDLRGEREPGVSSWQTSGVKTVCHVRHVGTGTLACQL